MKKILFILCFCTSVLTTMAQTKYDVIFTIKDINGNLMTSALVHIFNEVGLHEGSFQQGEAVPLPNGVYYCLVSPNGYAKYWDTFTVNSTGLTKIISYEDGYYPITFQLSGLEPNEAAQVSIDWYTPYVTGISYAQADPQTHQAILYLPDGAYDYTIRSQHENKYGQLTVDGSSQLISVDYSDSYPITFTLNLDGNLSNQADIGITDEQNNFFWTNNTNTNGIYQCHLTNGQYRYEVRLSTYPTIVDYFTVADASVEKAIQINSNEYNKIIFTIKDNEGNGIENMGVYVSGSNYATGYSNADGEAHVYLPDGNYSYNIYKEGYPQKIGTFSADGTPQPISITYDMVIVSGKVVNMSGLPVTGSIVAYPLINGKLHIYYRHLITLSDEGTFSQSMAVGKYYFMALGTHMGYLHGYYSDITFPSGNASPLHWENADIVDVLSPKEINIRIAKPDEIGTGEITLNGTVTEQDGISRSNIKSIMARPVAYATVILYGKSKNSNKSQASVSFSLDDYTALKTTFPDDNGNFSFGQLPQDMSYKLYIELPTYSMITDFELDPAIDKLKTYNINYFVHTEEQIVTSDYTQNSNDDDEDSNNDDEDINTGNGIIVAPIVNLYPNPATDLVRIEANFDEAYIIKVFNSSGKMIISTNSISPITTIDVSNLQPGVYLIRTETKTKSGTYKLIKN